MLDWLILGGGLQGTHLAIALLANPNVARSSLRILDTHAEPFHAWRKATRAVGMRYLRSASVHHVDLDPYSLRRFASKLRRGGNPSLAIFAAPYDRPNLELFDRHCDDTFERHRLGECRDVGLATDLAEHEDHVVVTTSAGELAARRVVLALGAGPKLRWPDWAKSLHALGAPIAHVFDPTFERAEASGAGAIAVVGGGSSATQLALALSRAGCPRVVFLPRRELRVSTFEVDPGWIGPKFMRGFASERDYVRRRSAILSARDPASLSLDVERELRAAVQQGRIERHDGEIVSASFTGQSIELTSVDRKLEVERVVLATGYDCSAPADSWIRRFAERHALPLGPCGFPILDEHLAWSRRVHVIGALAELELGPTARNLTGARAAAERLVRIAS